VKPLLNWYATHPISLHPAASANVAVGDEAPAQADETSQTGGRGPFMISVPHDDAADDVAPIRLP
jgi:hypothetical protein